MRLKKFFVSFLSAAVLLSFVSVSATADSNGWQGDYDSGWKYYTTFGGYVKNDWKSIDGKWYYFNSDGYMESNCYRDGYWLDKTGAWNPNYSHGTWKKNSVGWWYADNGWYPVSQWLWIDGECYYFDSEGYMESECYRDGCWLKKNGAWDSKYSHGTWKSNSTGRWYEDNGWYPKNCFIIIDGRCYRFDYDGFVENYYLLEGMTANEIVEECKRIWSVIPSSGGMTIDDYFDVVGYQAINDKSLYPSLYFEKYGDELDYVSCIAVKGLKEQPYGMVWRSDANNPDDIVWVWVRIEIVIHDLGKAQEIYNYMTTRKFRVTSDIREGENWQARADNPQSSFVCAEMNKNNNCYILSFTDISI